MLEETKKLIVDPIQKESLLLSNQKTIGKHIVEGILKTKNDDKYIIKNGVANLTPSENMIYYDKNILDIWNKIQQSGKILYEEFPTLNCSVKNRGDVDKFIKFSSFSGTVLDIGCGIKIPGYLQKNKKIKLGIGIDPLASLKEEELDEKIDLINAIGEYLPFQNESFDFISFGSSFDHVIDPNIVLNETKRVLKKNGRLIFWTGDNSPHKPNLMNRGFRKIKSIQNLFLGKNFTLIENQEKFIETLELPEGAEDKFHLRHLDLSSLNHLCEKNGFEEKRIEKSIPGSVFIEYCLI